MVWLVRLWKLPDSPGKGTYILPPVTCLPPAHLDSPVYREESQDAEVVQEESSELSLSRLEEELAEDDEMADSDDDGPVYLDLTGIGSGGDSEGALGEALESTVDTKEWRLEVERVMPFLKVHVRQDNRVSVCVCVFVACWRVC